MAAPQLIPAPCPRQDVPRTAAPSGVTHVRTYQPERYTIIGNHLAQHRQSSLVAIGLAVYILSLPDGAPSDIRTLAARFPEGRDRIGFALRELEACGYLARVRERVDGGRFVTRTYAYEVPGEPVPAAPGASADVHTVSRRDVRRLAPAVVTWFENGASRAAVRHALTDDVPVLLRNPARFLEYRLRELLPPPLPPSEPEAPGAAPAPQWYAMTTCAGECGRPFRAPAGSVCRDCRDRAGGVR